MVRHFPFAASKVVIIADLCSRPKSNRFWASPDELLLRMKMSGSARPNWLLPVIDSALDARLSTPPGPKRRTRATRPFIGRFGAATACAASGNSFWPPAPLAARKVGSILRNLVYYAPGLLGFCHTLVGRLCGRMFFEDFISRIRVRELRYGATKR